MKQLILLSIFVLITALSCEKPHPTVNPDYLDDHTQVEGLVYVLNSNEPLQNAEVILEECVGEFLGGSSCYNEDTAYTNLLGVYSFDFIHETSTDGISGYSYEVKAVKENYYPNSITIRHGWVNRDKNIELTPISWLKLHVRNIDPFDENDEVSFRGRLNNGGGGTRLIGQKVDEKFLIDVPGDQALPVTWYVEKDGEGTQFWDTLMVAPHDTLAYQILY